MFFEISKSKNEHFSSSRLLKNSLVINVDSGWEEHTINEHQLFFKGYHNEKFSNFDLFLKTIEDPTPKFQGNFFIILVDNKNCVITHDIGRASPLVKKESSISNLYAVTDSNAKTNIWADRFLTVDESFNVKENVFSPYTNVFPEYDLSSALKRVDNILSEAFESFLINNNKPIKLFLTGGIDTITLYAYLDRFTKKYELIDFEYKKFTHFYRQNWQKRLQKFWAYKQIHSWGEDPTVLVTGGNGDEYFLRGPVTANMMLMHYNINMCEALEQYPECYHYDYFKKEKNYKIFVDQQNDNKLKLQLKFKENTIKNILNILINDHQHWHIDGTIFFTPFKNIEIAKTILGLSKTEFVQQVLDASFQKQLIKNIDPDKLKFLSKFKNQDSLKFSNTTF